MNFFLVADSDRLVLLRSFDFREGGTTLVRIPTFGGDVFGRSRPEPDTFTMDATGLGQQVGAFTVVDGNCVVYECIGTTVSGANGQIQVSGFVTGRWQVEDANRAEAIRMMREAMGA
jgi:hypothetical protein